MTKIDINMLAKLITEDPDVSVQNARHLRNDVNQIVYNDPEKAIRIYTAIHESIFKWTTSIRKTFEKYGGAARMQEMERNNPGAKFIDKGDPNVDSNTISETNNRWVQYVYQILPYISIGLPDEYKNKQQTIASYLFGQDSYVWFCRMNELLDSFQRSVEWQSKLSIAIAQQTLQNQ